MKADRQKKRKRMCLSYAALLLVVEHAEDWEWSSAATHLRGENDRLVKVGPLLDRVEGWSVFLSSDVEVEEAELLRCHERTGRPLGSASFVGRLESARDRILRRQRPCPKREERDN